MRFLRAAFYSALGVCHFSEEVPAWIDLQAADSSAEHSSRNSSSLIYRSVRVPAKKSVRGSLSSLEEVLTYIFTYRTVYYGK